MLGIVRVVRTPPPTGRSQLDFLPQLHRSPSRICHPDSTLDHEARRGISAICWPAHAPGALLLGRHARIFARLVWFRDWACWTWVATRSIVGGAAAAATDLGSTSHARLARPPTIGQDHQARNDKLISTIDEFAKVPSLGLCRADDHAHVGGLTPRRGRPVPGA